MIYITGDTHGDFTRLSNAQFREGKTLTRDDYVIICGDFGGVWDGSRRDQYWLDWIESKPFTLLFVDGNHENFDLLNSFPCDEWKGGKVHVLRENILHLMRGQIFNIAGKKFFTMGGAASHDVWDGILDPDDLDFSTTYWRMRRNGSMFRVKGIDWWPEEMPSDAEYSEAIHNLESVNWDIDYVVSHCAPTSLLNRISTSYESDQLTDFLQLIKRMSPTAKWFCGHYHRDMQVTDHFEVLYNKIVKI